MKNNIDYIYEYSDLNLFQTRTKILQGEYADIILEFGGAFTVISTVNELNFEYALYHVPDRFTGTNLIGNENFETFLYQLLLSILEDKNIHSDTEHTKLMSAADIAGIQDSIIVIDDRFYSDGVRPTARSHIEEGCRLPLEGTLDF